MAPTALEDLLATPAESRASEELLVHVAALRAVQVSLARLLARFVREGRPFRDLAGSVTEFGHLHGLGGPEIHRLVSVGMVLEEHAEVEALLLSCDLSLDNAALL